MTFYRYLIVPIELPEEGYRRMHDAMNELGMAGFRLTDYYQLDHFTVLIFERTNGDASAAAAVSA